MIHAIREHCICAGHRVVNQGGACERLHGHEYKFELYCTASELNRIGMILDFGEIKKRLCQWLEDSWDHRMLLWEADPWGPEIAKIDPSVVFVPFNPTAEKIAEHMVEVVGPEVLKGTGVILAGCRVNETSKCAAFYELD